MRNPLRRRKTMSCVECHRTKPWPGHFVNRTFAECLACYLKMHPEQVEGFRDAIAVYDRVTERKK